MSNSSLDHTASCFLYLNHALACFGHGLLKCFRASTVRPQCIVRKEVRTKSKELVLAQDMTGLTQGVSEHCLLTVQPALHGKSSKALQDPWGIYLGSSSLLVDRGCLRSRLGFLKRVPPSLTHKVTRSHRDALQELGCFSSETRRLVLHVAMAQVAKVAKLFGEVFTKSSGPLTIRFAARRSPGLNWS